ncbi:hypothetical protein [Arundinibacter roseus]|uniref:Chromate transporter n=1 Tax=Arundinibacter roseus TaxID=2070510 RepID=A0A4R4KIE8_9BACT|nr:hypothetical protein [Arundinibacter roseus]TDB67944.1 hypothetical protein EZE20_03170 [Arundinibacter roseus]
MEQPLPLENEVRNVFSKFPAFPEGLTEFLVTLAPWGALIGAFLGVLAFLSLLGLGSLATFISIGTNSYGSTWQMWVGIIGVGINAVIYILAFQPLRARSIKGWTLMYYAFLVNLAVSLISLNFIGLVLSFLIGGWILYQVRPKYS